MQASVRVLVVSVHRLLRECVASLVATIPNFEASSCSPQSGEALQHVREWQPAILLLDLERTNAGARDEDLQLTRTIVEQHETVGVLLMGVDELDPQIMKGLELGARGFVSRDATLTRLQRAFSLIVNGGAVCSPRLAYSLFRRLEKVSVQAERDQKVEALKLTARELEILQLIAEGLSNRNIAELLFISIQTVKNHIHRIFEKLQVHRRAEAVAYAMERRWLRRRSSPMLRYTA